MAEYHFIPIINWGGRREEKWGSFRGHFRGCTIPGKYLFDTKSPDGLYNNGTNLSVIFLVQWQDVIQYFCRCFYQKQQAFSS